MIAAEDPTLGPDEAASALAAYRSLHVIEPEYPRGTREPNYCRTCGVGVYPIRRGWRHDMSEVAILDAIAEKGWPR